MFDPEDLSPISRRFVAFVIDGLILLIPNLAMLHVVPFIGGFVLWILYAPVLEASRMRATLGKKAMRIQVADLQGRRITFSNALVRNVIKLVVSPILFIGYIVAFFTPRRQALHDLVADTVVIEGEVQMSAFDAWAEQLRDIFNIDHGPATPGSAPLEKRLDRSVTDELERLHALREKGALTEEEFQAAKRRILGDPGPGPA